MGRGSASGWPGCASRGAGREGSPVGTEIITGYEAAWKRLRAQVKREQRSYEGKGTNKEDRTTAAALASAYGSVLRMMDRLDGRC